MGKSVTNYKVREDMRRLYKQGWSPEEIMLAFRSSNKKPEHVENFVMKAIKPLFS